MKSAQINSKMEVVQVTTDYHLFSFSHYNREIRVSEQMQAQAFRDEIVAPIIVDEHMKIFDGQHRFTALKNAGKPIRFIVEPGLDERNIVEMNTTQRSWTQKDYIDADAKKGVPDYVKLKQLIKELPFNSSTIIEISIFAWSAQEVRDVIHSRKFKFVNYDLTMEIADYAKNLCTRSGLKPKQSVVVAIARLYLNENIDKARLVKQCIAALNVEKLNLSNPNVTLAMKEILDAYNKGLRKNGHIVSYNIDNANRMTVSGEQIVKEVVN